MVTDWIRKTMPNWADKILHQIEDYHGSTLNENTFETRVHGEGEIAEQINNLIKLGKRKSFKDKISLPKLSTELCEYLKNR